MSHNIRTMLQGAIGARRWLKYVGGCKIVPVGGPDGPHAASWDRVLRARHEDSTLLVASMQWMASGFPMVDVEAKYAASLMCSSIASADQLRLPWDCFVVKLHGDIVIDSEFGPLPADMMMVRNTKPGRIALELRYHYNVHGQALGGCANHPGQTLDAFTEEPSSLSIPPDLPSGDEDLTDGDSRALRLAGRLLLGVLADMATSPRGTGVRAAMLSEAYFGGGGAAKPTVFKLTRPVRIDCRRTVVEYVANGGRSPLVRSLVRGHWRNQPHGPRSSLRKWIHIEPFWRGPEDAPIAVRSHILKGTP